MRTAQSNAKRSQCILSKPIFVRIGTLEKFLSCFFVSLRRSCIKSQPISSLFASYSKLNCKWLCGKASTNVNKSFFFQIINASCTCYRRTLIVLGPPFLRFLENGIVVRATFGIILQHLVHRPRNDFHSRWFQLLHCVGSIARQVSYPCCTNGPKIVDHLAKELPFLKSPRDVSFL